MFLPLWAEDKGRVTNKEDLPIRSFVYGGFISDKVSSVVSKISFKHPYFQQEANITVGKMKCSGLREASGSVTSSITCSSLKKDGAMGDGL